MISLEVLGTVTLETEGGQAVQEVLAQPKRLALLSFLAINTQREFFGREELFGLFWPELSTDRARAALSQALYFLRKKLGEEAILVRGKDEVGINRDLVCCDTAEFAQARQGADFHRMLELYRGDLLQGLFLLDGAEWEEWLETERRRLRNAAAEAAWALAEEAREAGEVGRAAQLGTRALELSGYDEPCAQRLLVLLDDLGDRAGVARLYREYSQRLRREYDIDVAPETQALYQQIMSRSPRPAWNAGASETGPGTDADESRARIEEEGIAETGALPARRRWQIATAALLLLVVGAMVANWLDTTGGSPAANAGAEVDSERLVKLTIMPFIDRDADTGMNYVAPGIREELYHRLSRLNRLRVLTPPAAPLSEDQGPAGGQAASTPRSDFHLSGVIVSDADGLQVELQLAGAPGLEPAREQTASFKLDDMLAASANAAEWTADQLLHELTPDDAKQLRSGVTTDNEAFTLYLRGRFQLMNANAEAFAKARELFEAALALDPAFARAWSGLADAFIGLSWSRSLPDVVAFPRAREAAERSLELNPGLAEGHASLAQLLRRYYWDSEGAERHFHEAIRLQPDNADAHVRYSAFLRNMGRFEQARVEVEKAIALDPLSIATHKELVILDLMEGRHDDAIRRSGQLVELHPDVPMARFFFARCLIAGGEFQRALDVLDEMPTNADLPPALTMRGYIMGRTGQPTAAEHVIRLLESLAEQAPDMPVHFDVAVVYLGLGDYQSALQALDLAAAERDYRVRLLAQEPMFQVLRGMPKFTELLQLAGLPVERAGDAAGRL